MCEYECTNIKANAVNECDELEVHQFEYTIEYTKITQFKHRA